MTNKVTESDLVILERTDDPRIFLEGGAVWVFTSYSGVPCSQYCDSNVCEGPHPDDCVVCGTWITEEDMDHYVCVDGGEAAHPACVEIHAAYPHKPGTLYDCRACALDDPDEVITMLFS